MDFKVMKVIDAEIITRSHIGKYIFILHITLTASESKLPFILNCWQFPVHIYCICNDN
jgi:hypothetical protein